MKNVLFITFLATLCLAPALQANSFDYVAAGLYAAKSEGFGFDETARALCANAHWRATGRSSLFGSACVDESHKRNQGDTNQTGYEAGFRLWLGHSRQWFAGLSARYVNLTVADSDRTDTSAAFHFGRSFGNSEVSVRYRAPDSSKYKTQSAGFLFDWYLPVRNRFLVKLFAGADYGWYKLAGDVQTGTQVRLGVAVGMGQRSPRGIRK